MGLRGFWVLFAAAAVLCFSGMDIRFSMFFYDPPAAFIWPMRLSAGGSTNRLKSYPLSGVLAVLLLAVSGSKKNGSACRQTSDLPSGACHWPGLIVNLVLKDNWGVRGLMMCIWRRIRFTPAFVISRMPQNCSFVSGHAQWAFISSLSDFSSRRRSLLFFLPESTALSWDWFESSRVAIS